MFREPNSLKLPVPLAFLESKEAKEGRLMSLTLGLGGLRDLFREVPRRTATSSDDEAKCFELTVGIGGAKVGD